MQQPSFCYLLKIICIYTFLFLSTPFYAQTIAPPGGINYQAIARDTTGNPMGYCNNLKVKFSIFDTITTGVGNPMFEETHDSVSTNRYGLFTLVIGSAYAAGFDSINWAAGSKFLEVSIDSGGNGFISMPRTQMVSVPYALHSKTALLSAYNWALEGNSTNSTHFLGTTNNSSLQFKTSNINRMIIDSLGRVGVGTLTPAALFEVAGQVKITGGTPGLGKVLTSDASGLAYWELPATTTPFTPGNGLSLLGTTLNSVWTASGNDIYNNNTGNVGVGTATPDGELEVISNSTNSPHGIISTEYSSNSFADAQIWLRKARGTENSPSAVEVGDELGFIKFRGWDSSNGFHSSDQTEIGAIASEDFTPGANGSYLRFMTTPNGMIYGSERMRIGQNGDVGINTTNPGSRLDVNGTISISGSNSNELNRTQTGSANLVPIAYGNVADSDSTTSGTGNFTVVWEGNPNNRYKITITGEAYVTSNYITLVTPKNDGPPENGNVKISISDDGSGNLLVTIYNWGGTRVQNGFQFITYKP